MSPRGKRRLHWIVGAAAGAVVMTTAVNVQAQDAFGGFFGQLFGARPAQPTVAPVYRSGPSRRYDPFARYRAGPPTERYEQAYRSRRSLRAARAPKSSYAALPQPGKEKFDSDKLAGKQFVDQKAINADPTAALLTDPTLRPGDIAVMPEGPKVFTGSTGRRKASGVRHKLRDFADVSKSGVVDKKTRQLLVSMMVPIGALPAHEARKYLAKLRKIVPDDDALPIAVQAHSDVPPRVIMPYGEQ